VLSQSPPFRQSPSDVKNRKKTEEIISASATIFLFANRLLMFQKKEPWEIISASAALFFFLLADGRLEKILRSQLNSELYVANGVAG